MACLAEDEILGKVWKFQIENGNTGMMSVVDPLLDTEERAEERALSEFLKNAYAVNSISFLTWMTTLYLNQVVEVGGMPYLIKSIGYSGDAIKIIITVGVTRYD